METKTLKSLKECSQTKLDELIKDIDGAIEEKKIEKRKYDRLIVKLAEASEKGISTRRLGEMTGISHATIARWLKIFKSAKGDA